MSKEDGFTLAEVLVVMTMLVVVLFALHALFDAAVRIMGVGEDELEAAQSARTGLEKMQREIRAAYPYDAAAGEDHLLWNTGDPTTGAIPAPARISFGNDLDGDGRVGCPPPPAPSSACEVISYRLYRPAGSPSYALGRAKSRAGNLQPVVGNVSDVDALEFEYLDAFGNPATSEPEVSAVRITLETEVGDSTRTLATEAHLRNRGSAG